LPFPVSEAGTIVVHFGEQKYQGLTSTKNVQYVSKDIQIRTKPGASALAVFGGIVSRIFPMPGANISVMIRHGNFLTVYANLSEVYVKSGEKVRLGQSIGKIYVDGEQNNETIMHFQIWREMERLNPELWLRKR
jgi:murein hydrolase activator